ncbi:hypothetical protein ACNVED_03945 [Legionella sp. D16C41]|uniref:hypothetical protein n=1 Tax=Legionella sp. D16C41 TaxID=3402688 RepID=UPI003AF6C833
MAGQDIARKKFEALTFRELHGIIRQSESIVKAAKEVGIGKTTLEKYLKQLPYCQIPFTYGSVKKIKPADLEKSFLGNCDAKLTLDQTPLTKRTFKSLHETILTSDNIYTAASRLGVNDKTLRSYLSKLPHIEQSLTFQLLKSKSEQEIKNFYPGDYEAIPTLIKIPLKQRTFKEIHQAIRASSGITDAASCLGVEIEAFQSYLNQLPFINEPLTYNLYDLLKNTEEKDIMTIYLGDYEAIPTLNKIPLNQRTFKEIHQAIRANDGISEAAHRLGVGREAFKLYLNQLPFINEPLTYKRLQDTEEKDIMTIYPGDYEAIPTFIKVPLNQRTFKEIHQAIRASSGISEAVILLGVGHQTFDVYLNQLPFIIEPLTYDKLQRTEEKDITTIYPGDYEAIPTLNKIPLNQRTFKEIHQAIRASNSILDAAAKLGTYKNSLAVYLSRLPHVDKPLTYDLLKEKAESEIGDIYPDAYEAVPVIDRLVFRELALEKIHNAIKNSPDVTTAASKLGCHYKSIKRFLDKLLVVDSVLTFDYLKSLSTTEFCNYVLHAKENNASARRRAPSSRALSNASDFDDNELPQETLLAMLDIIEDDIYFLAGVVDPFEETIEESPYPKHDAVSSSFPTEVNHKNASLAQRNLMVNPDDLTIENSNPMVLEDHTDLPLDFINSFSEAIEESPYPEHDDVASTEAVTLEKVTACKEDVNLDELTSWPADLIVQDSTAVSCEESATEAHDSGPSVEIEESASQRKSTTNSSSLQSLPTFFNLRGKRAAPEETIDKNHEQVCKPKVAKG